MSKRKNRYGKSCRVIRQLYPNEKHYDKIVAEVVYDYGTADEPRGYKLRVYLTEKNSEQIADNGRAIIERQIGHYTYQFCKMGWKNARKKAGALYSGIAEELLEDYSGFREPIEVVKEGSIINVGNLTFIEAGELDKRDDYTEKKFKVIRIDAERQIYICEPKEVDYKRFKPIPVFIRFSNDIFFAKCY